MSILTFVRGGMRHIKARSFHTFASLEKIGAKINLQGKVVVITGANSGIGKITAKQMAKRGAIVVMACRDVIKAEKVAQEIGVQVPGAKLIVVKIDLTNLDSVNECGEEIKAKFPEIHILINNAGYSGVDSKIERTEAGFEKHLATNYLGHFLLTLHLLECLKRGSPSRIVNIGSTMYEFSRLKLEDLNMEKKFYFGILNSGPYSNSKRCLMLFSKELGRRLDGTGVRTYALCPALSRTEIFRDFTGLTKFLVNILLLFIGCKPEQGVETVMHCAVSADCEEDTGKAYHFGRRWTAAEKRLTSEDAQKLWEHTEELLQIKSGDFGI